MKNVFILFFHSLRPFLTLLRPGGFKSAAAENLAFKKQLVTLNRGRRRALSLSPIETVIFGVLTQLINPKCLKRIAVVLKPVTFLKYHRALMKKKYQELYSRKTPGRPSLSDEVIQLALEMKRQNVRFDYQPIAMQIYQAFGIEINRFMVCRKLLKNLKKISSGDGPSWLRFIGQLTDHLLSADFFRCESITLKSH